MLDYFEHLAEADRINLNRYLGNIRKKLKGDDFKHNLEFFHEHADVEGKYQFHLSLPDFTVNENIRHVRILVQDALLENKTSLYGSRVHLERVYYHAKEETYIGVFYIYEYSKDIIKTMPEELEDYILTNDVRRKAERMKARPK